MDKEYMLMITLNTNNILNENTDSRFTINDATDFLESYFIIGLDYYNEFNEAYTDISSDFYTSLNEDVSDKLVVFNKFYNSAKKLIVDYTARMNNRVYNQFTSALSHRIHSDMNAMGPYLKKLSDYSGNEIATSKVRYKYSYIFDEEIPDIALFKSYANERTELDIALKSTRGDARERVLDDAFTKIRDYITSGDCYSYARAKLLKKKDTIIRSEDYATEIFKVYRSDGKEIYDPVDRSELFEIASRIKQYDRAINNVNNQKKKVFKEYQYIIDHLQNIDMFQSRYLEYSSSIQEKYEIYAKLKTDQLMHYCALYMQAFNGKLDAIANSYLQDREVLLKVCGALGMDISAEEGGEIV